MFPLLTAVAILIAVGAAATIKPPTVVGTATRHPVAISIEELHQRIDVKSLPTLEIVNLFCGR
jgi:hypothetical protein